jgi:pimeloyl-ACP methyl ester carboxylesterase
VLILVCALLTTAFLPLGTASARTVNVEDPPFAMPPAGIGSCHSTTFHVSLLDGSAAGLAAYQCTSARHSHVRTDLLLLHGGTYNASYWSWPIDPASRSTVWAALAAGYDVTALDRLGYGRSTHLLSSMNTFTQQAWTLHQTVVQLKNGTKTRFSAVVAVGHSFGSAEMLNQAALHPDDYVALVVTGSGSTVSAATTAATHTAFSPASSVAHRFAGRDPGYLTNTTAAGREATVYTAADTTPAMVTFDWQTEDTLTLGEIGSRPPTLNQLTGTIRVPVLLLDGMDDSHYCNNAQSPAPNETNLDNCSTAVGLYASERPHYAMACFAAAVVPHSGHDLTTEDGARTANRDIVSWLRTTITPAASHAGCDRQGPFVPPTDR